MAPNLAHICRSIWKWIYAKQIPPPPPETQGGHLGGFRGQTFKSLGKLSNCSTDWHQLRFTSADTIHLGMDIQAKSKSPLYTPGSIWRVGGHQFKSLRKLSNGCTDWHQIWYTSADSSGNGHRLNTIRPTMPQGHFGGLRGSQIQKSVEAVKRLDRLAPNLAHMCRFISEWIYAKQIALRDTRVSLGCFRGSNIQSLEKLSNGWTDWHQLWFTSADSSGNGHRLNTSRPTISQGAFGGGFMGSQIQMSEEAVKRLDRLAPNGVHVREFIWEWT